MKVLDYVTISENSRNSTFGRLKSIQQIVQNNKQQVHNRLHLILKHPQASKIQERCTYRHISNHDHARQRLNYFNSKTGNKGYVDNCRERKIIAYQKKGVNIR